MLVNGDLVQFDYAPDYKYCQSDVTRIFLATGKFTPKQREAYAIYLKLYQALMTSIKAHITPAEVVTAAVAKMDAIMTSYTFTDDHIKSAAMKVVEGYRRQQTTARGLGHTVGMDVHDVGGLGGTTLEPGRIFTIEPEMRIEEEHTGFRLEDMLLITDTGYENLSAFVPIDIAAIEKLMAEPSLSAAMKRIKGFNR